MASVADLPLFDVESDSGETFPVVDPATGEALAEIPRMGAAETRRAIARAEDALPAWRSRIAKDRARILRRWSDLMHEHEDELARLMTLEQGKPLAESRVEVGYAASFFEWFGEEAKRVYGDTIPTFAADRRIVVTKSPIGVTAGITPWNFPAAMPTRKAAPALASGCTMVLKPAEQTPLTALAIARLGLEAGLPEGVFEIVTGAAQDAPLIGGELTGNPTVRKLGFTGSTEVGKLLMAQCAQQVKKVSLELGGNAPGAIACKFRNSGQTCISANRIYVQDGIYDEFVSRLVDAVAALTVGSGLEPDTKVGPLIEQSAIDKVQRHVDDALERGGELLQGGEPLGGLFWQPTVIAGVVPEAAMSSEETFGPVAGLARFSTEEEAIRSANDTPYGLAAYYYTRDSGRIWRLSEALEYGIHGINTGFISSEVAPFGGVKESGIGREGSKYGIEEWLEIKYLCIAGV